MDGSDLPAVGAVLIVDPRNDERWKDLVVSQESSVFVSPEWVRVMAQTYNFDTQATILMGKSGPSAGLLYTTVDGMNGRRRVSFPFSDYCDPLVSSTDQWMTLSNSVLAAGLPLTTRCLHNSLPLEDRRFSHDKRSHWHSIDLRPDETDLWDHLDASAKKAIRRSRAAKVDVRRAQSREELRTFYDLHLRTRKLKYRLLAQPYSFFENIWTEFIEQGKGTLLLAHVDGQIAAGVLFLEWQDTLYYKFNASDPALTRCRPNDALMWAGIEYGRERGHKNLDLGLSDWDQEGLVRYKRKYASEEKIISFLSHLPEGAPDKAGSSPLQHLMPTLTDLFTDCRVPDEITERAGARLYRYFA